MSSFDHLNVPDQWGQYFTKYPQGYTILEALLNWVQQVDDMVDNVNDWNTYLDSFVLKFDKELQDTVGTTLSAWQASGFLGQVISAALETNKADKTALKGQVNLAQYDSYKVGDNYSPAIQKACEDLVALYGGGVLVVPAGTYNIYSSYSIPANVGIEGRGNRQAIFNAKTDTPNFTLNDNSFMKNMKLVNTFSTVRGTANLNVALVVSGKKVLVDNVHIDGSKTVGIMVTAAADVIVRNCLVENTLADGIHITDGSTNVLVTGCTVKESGDDSFAVVSYQSQANVVSNIRIVNNYTYHSKSRGVAVVGGVNVLVEGNQIDTPRNAGVYLAMEGSYNTRGLDEIDILNNLILNANSYGQTTNYAGIHLSCSSVNYALKNIRIKFNTVVNSRWRMVSIGGSTTDQNLFQDVTIEGNEFLSNTSDDGINFANCQNLSIKDNKIKQASKNGIFDSTNNSGVLSIKRNNLTNANTSATAATNGMNIRATTYDLVDVTDNKVIDTNTTLNRTIQITTGQTKVIAERNSYTGGNRVESVGPLTANPPVYIGQTTVASGIPYMAIGTAATTDWKALI